MKKMRQLLAILCILTIVFALTACGKTKQEPTQTPSEITEQTETATLNYPTKNVSLIIPYSAGGDADNMFRCMEPVMSKYLDGIVVVGEIVSGGNAIPGTQQALDAAADGYQIVIAYPGNICIQPNLGNASYQFEDLQAVACITAAPVLFAVNEDAPYDDFAGWLEWVKANPGKFTFCTGSLGGTPHLAMVKMLNALGIQDDVVYVPYSGNSEAYAAVAGGEIGGYAAVAGSVIGKEFVKPIINLGTVAPTGGESLPMLNDFGVDMAQATDVFCGYACSSKVDPEIVNYLSDIFEKVMADPEVMENMANMKLTANYMNHDDFQKYLDDNYEAYAVVIDQLGLVQS